MRVSWGTGIAFVYTAFAFSTAGVVAFAMAHPVDLVGSDYYEASTKHDARIAATERADAAGPLEAVVDTNFRELRVTLPAEASKATAGTLSLYRPSAARADRHWTLAVDPSGTMNVSLAGLAPGRWRLRVQWTSNGQPFYQEHALVLP